MRMLAALAVTLVSCGAGGQDASVAQGQPYREPVPRIAARGEDGDGDARAQPDREPVPRVAISPAVVG